ncbi:hypothetical protein AB432_009015 [Brevibacillus brevis]|uniref:Uncharacterized protein n=1 Tax=Brevibacillus brevis TaxID=1393 RepID=A0A2Z4MFN6_BREBE|nr:hypothetical protein [Brevibacillus brevis]AWX55171.1 hypothetical protein AB432_009015 [Brevibacillus brevis]
MIHIQWDGIDVEKTPKVFINGIDVTEHEDISFFGSRFTKKYSLIVYDSELSKTVSNIEIKDIPKELETITISLLLDFLDDVEKIDISYTEEFETAILNFRYFWDWEHWKQPYSIQEFADTMEKILYEYEEQGLKWVQEDEILTNGCHIKYIFNGNTQSTIKEIIAGIEPVLKEIVERAYAVLYSNTSDHSLISSFNFPPEVRTACEQYLVYFVQFLQDIGIEATSSIKNEAGITLFSVTPTSSEDALEQIKAALEIYLELPVSMENSSYVQVDLDPKVHQLIANVHHLSSQLSLSQALVQAQKVTIQNQQITITQQQQFIDSTILQQALISNQNEDKEEILGGTVSITKYQGNGFEVNIPNIFRWTKKLIGKE